MSKFITTAITLGLLVFSAQTHAAAKGSKVRDSVESTRQKRVDTMQADSATARVSSEASSTRTVTVRVDGQDVQVAKLSEGNVKRFLSRTGTELSDKVAQLFDKSRNIFGLEDKQRTKIQEAVSYAKHLSSTTRMKLGLALTRSLEHFGIKKKDLIDCT